jgi:hypothetical protein
MGHHTGSSEFEVGHRVKVIDTRYLYRDEKIIGATGKILRLDFDGSNGWSYCVQFDDPSVQQWADTTHKPPKKGEVHYNEEWFSEQEVSHEHEIVREERDPNEEGRIYMTDGNDEGKMEIREEFSDGLFVVLAEVYNTHNRPLLADTVFQMLLAGGFEAKADATL